MGSETFVSPTASMPQELATDECKKAVEEMDQKRGSVVSDMKKLG